MILGVNPLIALGVLASTATTDAAYVFFNAAVTGRHRVRAANWSAIWYLLSAFAVISYTENWIYVLFAATGSWLGAFASVSWLRRGYPATGHAPHNPPNAKPRQARLPLISRRRVPSGSGHRGSSPRCPLRR